MDAAQANKMDKSLHGHSKLGSECSGICSFAEVARCYFCLMNETLLQTKPDMRHLYLFPALKALQTPPR